MSIEDFQRHALSGPAMGSRWSAVLFARPNTDLLVVEAALARSVAVVEAQMSTWIPESDLMRLNAAPVGDWVALPEALIRVLQQALRIGRDSGGAFDIGVGDAVAAWGFGAQARQPDGSPTVPAVDRTRPKTMDGLELDPVKGRGRKTAPLTLDLSGIAKGFGVDEMARVLDGMGFRSFLVGIDGEMRARGTKPDGQPWAVALEQPEPGVRAVRSVIALSDQSVATSGDYRHWIDVEGTRLSHTIHPFKGAPVQNRVASVTVLHESCMTADAWATALLVLGETAGPVVARANGLSALFVLRGTEGLEEIGVGPVFEG